MSEIHADLKVALVGLSRHASEPNHPTIRHARKSGAFEMHCFTKEEGATPSEHLRTRELGDGAVYSAAARATSVGIEALRDASPAVPREARRVDGDARFVDPQAAPVIVIDQRLLIRDCLLQCLRQIGLGCNVLAFSSVTEYVEAAAQYAPLLILFSLQPKHCDNTEMQQDVLLLSRNASNAPVVVISDSEDINSVVSILKCGARGYIPTSVTLNVAIEAMRLVGAGGTFAPPSILLNAGIPSDDTSGPYSACKKAVLTARQLAVLVAVRRGKANKQIAYELNMREGTVKVHLRHIMKKLRARNRTEAAIIANELFAPPSKLL